MNSSTLTRTGDGMYKPAIPASFAFLISSGVNSGERYSVIRYSTLGSIFSKSSLYFSACSVVVTGGFKLGLKYQTSSHQNRMPSYDLFTAKRTMTYARSKPPLRTWGTMRADMGPCRRWTWKSAGALTVIESDMVCSWGGYGGDQKIRRASA
jgi:hypothetical protein